MQAGVNTTPWLTGNLYLNNSAGVRARMQIVYYDATHKVIATRNGNIQTGTGGLNTWAVNLGNVTSTSTHVHVNLLDDRSGSLQVVASTICDLGVGSCF